MSRLFLTIGLLCIYCCTKESSSPSDSIEEDGVVIAESPIWLTPLTESDQDFIYTDIRNGVVYDKKVLMPQHRASGESLAMLSAYTGEHLWTWTNSGSNPPTIYIPSHYTNKDLMVFPGGSGEVHAINLDDGSTADNYVIDDAYLSVISGIGSDYFISSETVFTDRTRAGIVYRGRLGTSNYTALFSPPYRKDTLGLREAYGTVSQTYPFVSEREGGDTLLTFCYSDPIGNFNNTISSGLYNLTADSFVYTGRELRQSTRYEARLRMETYQDKVFVSFDDSIICYHVYDGTVLWEKPFDNSFTFSGFIVADGVLLANNEDTYLYGIDPTSGRQLWKEKSSGTSSHMVAHNGVVYFVGGGDGLLHAVEIATGRHLWKLRSPDEAKNSGAFFMPLVAVVPPESETDKALVVVSSYLSAMAFEAAR